MKNLLLSIIALSIALVLFSSCTKEKTAAELSKKIQVGSLKVYTDENISWAIEKPLEWYQERYPKIVFSDTVLDARTAMMRLFEFSADAIILSRDFLPDEDSLLKFSEQTRLKIHIAEDGLVFFGKPDFPIDTLNISQVEAYLTDKSYSLSNQFKQLDFEPQIVTLDRYSAIYANLQALAANSKDIKRKIKFVKTVDDIKKYIDEHPQSLGVAYLSHIYQNPDYLSIRMGFFHKDGKRELPQIVHPSWLVMKRYPYVVNYYVYIQSNITTLPSFFAEFMKKNDKVTKYWFDNGIMPEHAKFQFESY